jgi:hypothetical protein
MNSKEDWGRGGARRAARRLVACGAGLRRTSCNRLHSLRRLDQYGASLAAKCGVRECQNWTPTGGVLRSSRFRDRRPSSPCTCGGPGRHPDPEVTPSGPVGRMPPPAPSFCWTAPCIQLCLVSSPPSITRALAALPCRPMRSTSAWAWRRSSDPAAGWWFSGPGRRWNRTLMQTLGLQDD